MAKSSTIKVKLVSSADTGFYYVTRKNSRTMTEKLKMKKYDPVAKKHVEFSESEDQIIQDQVSLRADCGFVNRAEPPFAGEADAGLDVLGDIFRVACNA